MALAPLGATNVNQDGGPPSDDDDDSVFHIPSKPPLEMLRKWRKATLALNASRRFRYTLDLKNKEEVSPGEELKNGELVSRFRTVTHALRAVRRFEEAGRRCSEDPIPEGFGIAPSQLQRLMQDQELDMLEKRGGVRGIAKLLKSNVETGIDDEASSIEQRQEAFGVNKVPPKPGKSLLGYAWEACHDTTLIILMICALVSLPTEMWSDGPKEGWYDGFSIGMAVLIVVVVTAVSDYRQSLQFQSLNEEKKNVKIEVIRGGRRFRLSVYDIVAGDIVAINIGDQVPADGILVSGHSLSLDESSMTGESLPVHKDKEQPFLLSGCKVSDGYGTMMVIAVGMHTEWGQILSTLSEDNGEETPLQVRLNGAATFIGIVGVTVAVLVFVILFIRFFAVDFKDNKTPSKILKQFVKMFSIAVTIVVVAVPEGLPLAVTLTLAYSMRKMMADKALVRNLAACETMGSATTICSDKTGTLTLNQMVVVRSKVADRDLEPENIESIPDVPFNSLLVGICCNTSGGVFTPKDGGKVEVSGSPTESAVLTWGVLIGMNYEEIKRNNFVVHVETFNSQKKRAGVVVRRQNGDVEAHWKGAAEMILEKSDKWVDSNGELQPMHEQKAQELNDYLEGMAAKSLRCIAFAYRELEPTHVPESAEELRTWEIPDEHLTFIAAVGIKDPCRPGVREAVGRCQAAGVKVRMVTGDSVLTAKAIAQECGILTKEGNVVEGRVFRNCTPEERKKMLRNLDVMARSSPTDKLLLVKALKENGDVVAVTGDGTNDAPALHDADVGLSMGIAGTEVAKESSDIVVLDDNFASIVKVVRWGRSVYANIQKFIQFQLTVNVTALVMNFVAAASTGKVPLTVVQLLWVNLIMDTLGALALATEEPTDDLMAKAPVGRREPLITNIMWRNLLTQATYQIAVLMVIDYGGKKLFKLEKEDDPDLKKNTIIFNAFVLCQVFNEVNSRRPEKKNIFQGILKNYLFVGIILVEVILQFVIVQYLRKFADTASLTWQQWLACVGIGFVAWPLAFVVKFFKVREKPYVDTTKVRNITKRKCRKLKEWILPKKSENNASSGGAPRDVEGSKSTTRESEQRQEDKVDSREDVIHEMPV